MTEVAYKKSLHRLSKDKIDLQDKVDTLEAEVQMSNDLRARDQADVAKQIDDAREETIDNAWYCLWSTNPGVLDLTFLGEELEPTMAWWKTRLEEEELETITEAVRSEDEEADS